MKNIKEQYIGLRAEIRNLISDHIRIINSAKRIIEKTIHTPSVITSRSIDNLIQSKKDVSILKKILENYPHPDGDDEPRVIIKPEALRKRSKEILEQSRKKTTDEIIRIANENKTEEIISKSNSKECDAINCNICMHNIPGVKMKNICYMDKFHFVYKV